MQERFHGKQFMPAGRSLSISFYGSANNMYVPDFLSVESL